MKKSEYAPMKKPRTGIVGLESNCRLVSRSGADANDITLDRINPVVSTVSSTAHNEERVLWVSSMLDI